MERKYVIYKDEKDKFAWEYIDSKEGIKRMPYVSESSLPICVNRVGGYHPFNPNCKDFVEIITVDRDEDIFMAEDFYDKNSDLFEYGWLSPEGDTYDCGFGGHFSCAEAICEEMDLKLGDCEHEIEKRGWIKITGSFGEYSVYANDYQATQQQLDTLFDLGLWDNVCVKAIRKRMQCN